MEPSRDGLCTPLHETSAHCWLGPRLSCQLEDTHMASPCGWIWAFSQRGSWVPTGRVSRGQGGGVGHRRIWSQKITWSHFGYCRMGGTVRAALESRPPSSLDLLFPSLQLFLSHPICISPPEISSQYGVLSRQEGLAALDAEVHRGETVPDHWGLALALTGFWIGWLQPLRLQSSVVNSCLLALCGFSCSPTGQRHLGLALLLRHRHRYGACQCFVTSLESGVSELPSFLILYKYCPLGFVLDVHYSVCSILKLGCSDWLQNLVTII